MKGKSALVVVIVAVVLALSLGGFGCKAPTPTPTPAPTPAPTPTPTPTPTPEKVFNLSLSDIHPAEDPMNSVIAASWFKWLERESKGRIKMTLLHSAQAAPQEGQYDAARTGIVNIAVQVLPALPGRFPISEVVDLPFMFDYPSSRAQSLTLMALYEKYPELQAEFPDVKVLFFHASAGSELSTVKKQVRTMQDLKGMVLLSVGTYNNLALAALGATPELINPFESYDALVKGVLDGSTVNWMAQQVFGQVEAIKYSTETCMCVDPFIEVMNLDTWNSLPADLQALFVGENAWRISELYGYRFDVDNGAARDAISEKYKTAGLPEVYTLPAAEKAKWLEKVQPVWEEWVKTAAAKVGEAKARAILEDAQKFAKQYSDENFSAQEKQKDFDTLHDWGAPGY